jgi:hypothetical protein
MGKVIDGGLAPKDHPLFTGGWQIATVKTLKQALEELEKETEPDKDKSNKQKETRN